MPENMTWWEAKRYALAGVPVRRQVQYNPVKWFTYTTGLYLYHEEINNLLADPADADPTVIIVTNAHFTADEFLAHDWTTLGPYGPGNKPPETAPLPPDPPDLPPGLPEPGDPGVNYPPRVPTVPIGGSDGAGGTTGGAGGVGIPGGALPTGGSAGDGGTIVVINPPALPPGGPVVKPPPQPPPAAPFPLPTLTATADSGTPEVTASITGIGPDQAWSVIAADAADGLTISVGQLIADGTVSHSAAGLSPGVPVGFRATCLDGPQTLRGQYVIYIVAAAD